MSWFRRAYGAGPFHLAGILGCAAITLYAADRVVREGGARDIFLLFAALVVAHDLIGWPLLAAADRALARAQSSLRARREHNGPSATMGSASASGAQAPELTAVQAAPRRRGVPWLNHVRFPALVSALLFLMFFPLVLRLSSSYYAGATGFSENTYLGNWLAVTASLFVASGAAYAVRLASAVRRSRSLGQPVPSEPAPDTTK